MKVAEYRLTMRALKSPYAPETLHIIGVAEYRLTMRALKYDHLRDGNFGLRCRVSAHDESTEIAPARLGVIAADVAEYRLTMRALK